MKVRRNVGSAFHNLLFFLFGQYYTLLTQYFQLEIHSDYIHPSEPSGKKKENITFQPTDHCVLSWQTRPRNHLRPPLSWCLANVRSTNHC